MRCEIIGVGTELLLGQIVNTNAAWIGQRLADVGWDCLRHTVVGDNEGRIAGTVREALGRADAAAELCQPFPCAPACVVAQFVNQIMRRSKHPRELIRQGTQNACGKRSIASATFDDGPLFRTIQLIVELREVTCESRCEEFASLRTRAIVAFPAPSLEIRSLIITTGGIVKRRPHPIVKCDGTFASN
mgnify:CR=1 FL=1